MAKVKAAVIDTDPAKKSVKELREEIKTLKDSLVNLQKGTKEYNDAILRTAEIQHLLKEINEEANASAADTGVILSNCTKTFRGLIGAVEAATGVMALFGATDEDALKVTKALTALIAVVQGLSAIDEGIKAFKRLNLALKSSTLFMFLFNKETKLGGVLAKTQAAAQRVLSSAMLKLGVSTKAATGAIKLLRTALISTGIGAIVVAVGALIANWERFTALFGKTKEKFDTLQSQLNTTTTLMLGYSNSVSQLTKEYEKQYREEKRLFDLMKARGDSQKDIDAQEIKMMQQKIEANTKLERTYKSQLETFLLFNKELVSAQDRELDINQKILSAENHIRILQDANANDTARGSSERIKQREELIKKRENEVQIYKQYLELLEKHTAAEEGIKDAENELLIIRERQAQALKKEEVDDMKRIISINEVRREGYKYSLEGLAAYMAYYNALKNLYSSDSKEFKDAEAEKTKYLIEYAKEARLQEEEMRALLADNLTIEEQRTNELNALLTKHLHAMEAANADKLALEEIYKKEVIAINTKYDKIILDNELTAIKHDQDLEESLIKSDLARDKSAREEQLLELEYDLAHKKIAYEQYYEDVYKIQQQGVLYLKELARASYFNDMLYAESSLDVLAQQLELQGLSEELINEIKARVDDLNKYKEERTREYNETVASLEHEYTENSIAEHNRMVDDFAAKLDELTSITISAINGIIEASDGLSTKWAQAADTMLQSLNNLATAVKAGGAGWSDYTQLASAAMGAVGQMMGALADQQDASNREGFEQLKKYQIAGATMSMLAGITAAISGLFTTKSGPWDIALAAIQAGLISAMGIAQIANIKKQQFNSSSTPSTGNINAGATTRLIAPVQYTQDIQGAEIEGALKDQRVYVTENDISSTQRRVSIAENENKY